MTQRVARSVSGSCVISPTRKDQISAARASATAPVKLDTLLQNSDKISRRATGILSTKFAGVILNSATNFNYLGKVLPVCNVINFCFAGQVEQAARTVPML